MDTFHQYQIAALKSAIYPSQAKIVYPALKLTGEAGEVSEKIGKWLRGDFFMDEAHKKEIAKELGDVLWYITALAYDLGYDLRDVAKMNIEKLNSRVARGTIQGDGDNR